MEEEIDYYELLEVQKDASGEQIRKAYLKMAHKHHPDRNNHDQEQATRIFKNVKRAYDILSDPDKRDIYDQFGEEGLREDGPGGDFRGGDIFSQFFGMGGGQKKSSKNQRGDDITFPLEVSLEDLYNGKTTKISVKKSVICSDCDGKGSKGGKVGFKSCKDCNGQGRKIAFRQIGGGMVQQVLMNCPSCQGQGEMINEKDKCTKCNAAKVVEQKKMLDVYIDKGMNSKQKITFSGESDQMPGMIPGDIVLVLSQKPHPIFKRSGDDLLMERELSLCEALCGFSFQISHLDKRILNINSLSSRVIEPGDTLCIENEGMPHWRDPFTKGRLVVTFSVKFPSSSEITPDIVNSLRKLLPNPSSSSPIKPSQSQSQQSQQSQSQQSQQSQTTANKKKKKRKNKNAATSNNNNNNSNTNMSTNSSNNNNNNNNNSTQQTVLDEDRPEEVFLKEMSTKKPTNSHSHNHNHQHDDEDDEDEEDDDDRGPRVGCAQQ